MDEIVYLAKNPWRQGAVPVPPKLDRRLFEPFELDLDRPEILVLLGARQVGKTTLLLEMARRALATGRATPDSLHYLDLDTMRCDDVLASNRAVLDFLGLRPGDLGARRKFLLIDEVQRLESPGLLLKSVHDVGLPLKLIVTGSSSLEIRSRVRETLAGRSIRHYLWPLTLEECRGTDLESLEEYLRWGGFPAVALAPSEAERSTTLANLLESYLDRDIADFLRVENVDVFSSFVRLLASQVGGLVNLNELAGTLGVSRDTLSRYLAYLESTFMVRVLRPFAGNRRGELTKMPKVFFADLGLRNLLAGSLAAGSAAMADKGPLFENLVEMLIRRDPRTDELHFWRTRSGAEVDFVWRAAGKLYAVEVKSAARARFSVSRSLSSFITTYRPERAAIVAPGASGCVEHAGTEVRFLPPQEVPLLLD